jgi:N-acetylmuramoyl-L-alanine amidase
MKPTHIIIHHSLTKDGTTVSWGAIRDYHLSLGWNDIGYHYGIELIGNHHEILLGRFSDVPGAHCSQNGMNRKSIGICVVGNFDLEAPPEPAMVLLTGLVRRLMSIYGIPAENVEPHRKYATYKSCPGNSFPWDKFKSTLV